MSDSPPDDEATSPTREEGTQATGGQGPFGGLSPAEAGKRSHEPTSARTTKNQDTSDEAILSKLRQKAAKGDVAAAKTVMEWEARRGSTELHGDAWLARLTAPQRAQLRQWIEEAEAKDRRGKSSAPDDEEATTQEGDAEGQVVVETGTAPAAVEEAAPHPPEARDSGGAGLRDSPPS